MHAGKPRYRKKPGASSIGIPEQLEDDLQRDVLQLLAYMGVLAESTHDSRSRQPKEYSGRSDISGILPGGRALRIELKRLGEKPSEEQRLYLDRAGGFGALAFWADSVEDVRTVIAYEMKKGALSSPRPGDVR